MDRSEFDAEFFDRWVWLCRRFGKEASNLEAADYCDFVADRLSLEQMRDAFRAIWSSREFFPRPVDFIMAAHAGIVTQLRAAADARRKDSQSAKWLEVAGGPHSVAMAVARAIGGIEAVYSLMEAGAGIMRKEVEATLAEILTDDARHEPGALPAGRQGTPALPWRTVGVQGGPQRVGDFVLPALQPGEKP